MTDMNHRPFAYYANDQYPNDAGCKRHEMKGHLRIISIVVEHSLCKRKVDDSNPS